jgi:hypothetical protein
MEKMMYDFWDRHAVLDYTYCDITNRKNLSPVMTIKFSALGFSVVNFIYDDNYWISDRMNIVI